MSSFGDEFMHYAHCAAEKGIMNKLEGQQIKRWRNQTRTKMLQIVYRRISMWFRRVSLSLALLLMNSLGKLNSFNQIEQLRAVVPIFNLHGAFLQHFHHFCVWMVWVLFDSLNSVLSKRRFSAQRAHFTHCSCPTLLRATSCDLHEWKNERMK